VLAIAIWIRLTLKLIRVVDVGCGPGHLIEALQRGGIDVLGSNTRLRQGICLAVGTSIRDIRPDDPRGGPGLPRIWLCVTQLRNISTRAMLIHS
jgi:hypothetical protein